MAASEIGNPPFFISFMGFVDIFFDIRLNRSLACFEVKSSLFGEVSTVCGNILFDAMSEPSPVT